MITSEGVRSLDVNSVYMVLYAYANIEFAHMRLRRQGADAITLDRKDFKGDWIHSEKLWSLSESGVEMAIVFVTDMLRIVEASLENRQ